MRAIVTAAILGGPVLATAPASAQTGGNLPPTAPGDLRVVDVTPFSVVLAWDASTDDRDGSRLSYTVYGPADGPFGDRWGWAYETTSTTVERLTPGTTYTFTVRGMDSWAQESEPSEPVTVRTEEIDPLPVPTNVRVTRDMTGTEVGLAFDAADDPRIAFYNRGGAYLALEQASKHRAFCFWCLMATGATAAAVPYSLAEAGAALRRVRGA